MNRTMSLLGGLLCLSLTAGSAYLAASHFMGERGEPVADLREGLIPDRTTHDFASVSQQETLSTQFRLTNRYPQVVTIEAVDHGCACSQAEIEPGTIPPGQSATLSVSWRTGARRGEIGEALRVRYAVGEEQPRVRTLTLKATVLPEFDLDPPSLTFVANVPGEQVVRLVPLRGGEVTVKKVAGSIGLVVTINEPPATITVRYSPTTGIDPILGDSHVLIGTTSPQQPWIQLPVTVRPKLASLPARQGPPEGER